MFNGVLKQIERGGRVCVPSAMLKSLELGPGDLVDITIRNGDLVLSPMKFKCACCRGKHEKQHQWIDGVCICPACIAKIKTLDVSARIEQAR